MNWTFYFGVMKQVKYLNKILLSILIIILTSCSLIEKFAGVDYNIEEFNLKRQLKIKEVSLKSAKTLQEKLTDENLIKQTDIIINLNESLLNEIFSNYKNSSAWMDNENSYYIKDLQIKLLNGVGLASINLIVKNISHNITVDLATDCLILIEKIKDSLKLKLEPFNVSPLVNTKGFYKIFNTTIDKSIRLQLSEISKKLPGIPIPISVTPNFKLNGLNKNITSTINLNLTLKDIDVNSEFSIKDILFLNNQVVVLLNLINLKVQ